MRGGRFLGVGGGGVSALALPTRRKKKSAKLGKMSHLRGNAGQP